MGEVGEDTLGKIFMERFGSGSGRKLGSPVMAIFSREMRGEEKEERKKKGLTKPVLVAGHQPCWRPTVSKGHQ
jgi:hypothetical protein